MIDVLANVTVVIVLRYLHVRTQHIVRGITFKMISRMPHGSYSSKCKQQQQRPNHYPVLLGACVQSPGSKLDVSSVSYSGTFTQGSLVQGLPSLSGFQLRGLNKSPSKDLKPAFLAGTPKHNNLARE